MLMVDTCFLIDFQREVKARRRRSASAFLTANASQRLQISAVAWGEFLAGFPDKDDPFVCFVRDRLDILPLLPEVSSVYSQVYRNLKATGSLIGSNDLWIASHAMALKLALVTRNQSDFRRISDLQLVEY